MTPVPPLIAIVGRPNVGKSTLFNRLVGGRPALVHDTPGLTRDRRYGTFDYFGHDFRVVDTGGLDPEAERDVIGAGIHRQARAALEQSDAVLFVVDATTGVTALDREVVALLRKIDKPVLVCANKVDSPGREALIHVLHELGIGEVFPISAVHGRGVDELLDALVRRLDLPPPARATDEDTEEDEDEEAADPAGAEGGPEAGDQAAAAADQLLRVAFVGKPNAGKSSLLNRLVGAERALVHHEPGTTTDPVDTELELGGRRYLLVDTAGMRRKARIEAETEKIAVSMAMVQIRRADVVVLVIDAQEGASEQDARLASAIEESGRAVVVALNKADLLGGAGAARPVMKAARDQLHFLPYAPVVLISALRGDGIHVLMAAVDRVARQYRRRITTGELNRFFADVCESHPPPIYRGRSVRVHYLTQAGVAPPTFLLFANQPDGLSPGYRRFVQNQLRARYGFEGTPLRVVVRAKRRRPAKPRKRGRR